MNEDRITVAVTRTVDGEQKTEAYSLTFEEYALVKPVFDAAEKSDPPFPQLPAFLPGLFGGLFQPPVPPQRPLPPITPPSEYNIACKPDNLTLQQVLEIKDRHNVLVYDLRKRNGKPLAE